MRKIAFAFVVATAAFYLAGSAMAEQNQFEKQLVGTWTLASTTNTDGSGAKVEPFGSHPVGAYMFDANGNVMQVITSGDQGAPKSIVATYGKYTMTDDGKTLVIHFIAGNPPSLEGTDQKRSLSFSNDEFSIHNSSAQSGGPVTTADSVWRRAK